MSEPQSLVSQHFILPNHGKSERTRAQKNFGARDDVETPECSDLCEMLLDHERGAAFAFFVVELHVPRGVEPAHCQFENSIQTG